MEKVLIVDDEAKMRKILKVFLLRSGRGKLRQEVSGSFRPHVVVMDLVMPDIGGIDEPPS